MHLVSDHWRCHCVHSHCMSYGGMIQWLAKEDHCILDTGVQKIVPAATKAETEVNPVNKATCWKGVVEFQTEARVFLFVATFQTTSWAHLASCSVGTDESFSGVKWLQHKDHQSPPSSAMAKKEWSHTSFLPCSHGFLLKLRTSTTLNLPLPVVLLDSDSNSYLTDNRSKHLVMTARG